MSFLDQSRNLLLQKLGGLRIQEKLDNNEALLPGQRSEVEHLLDEGEGALEGYDMEIERLQSAIETIQKLKLHLIVQLQSAKSLLAPIRTLPLELMALIFETYVEEQGGINLSSLKKDINVPPATLGAVCRLWRNITMCTPSIWSGLRVHLETSVDASELIIILSRSCNQDACQPLILEILGLGCDDIESRVLLDVLIAESGRWKKLTLYNDELEDENAVQRLSIVSGNVPMLEHLFLKGFFGHSETVPFISAFLDAPRLSDIYTEDMSANICLPYSQLTTIKCQIYESPARALALCSRARSLSVELSPDGEGWDMYADPCQLLCKSLKLMLTSGWWLGELTRYELLIPTISCPKLKKLAIEDPAHKTRPNPEYICYYPLGPIQSLIQKSSHLRVLSLERIAFKGNILELLEGIPLLEDLTILGLPDYLSEFSQDYFSFHPSFLSALTPSHGDVLSKSSMLLPRLTRLEFGIENPPARFSVSAFQALVRSRWLPNGEVDGIVCLREVVVRTSNMDLADMIAESLKASKNRGMDISIFRAGEHFL
jgi:hypothetical protein